MDHFLRNVALFAGLPDEDLDRLCEMLDEVRLEAGQELFAQGTPGDSAYVIESGELEIIKADRGRSVLLAVRKSGDVIGEIALLEDIPRTATVRARSDSKLYKIHQEQFERLLNSSPTASHILLKTVMGRLRNTAAALRQSEKMAQLGTLTAGVAHELNNPAAAVGRGVAQLGQSLAAFSQAQIRLAGLELNEEQQAVLDDLTRQVQQEATRPGVYLDPLERSDREAELEAWLEARGVAQAWELAPTLVDLGYDPQILAGFAGRFSPTQLPAVGHWLGATYGVYNLVAEISQGASRIAEIVQALKAYSYLDQAPVQEVDVHVGIDNTLLILQGKLARVRVLREYAADLPRIQAYGSELNQVWTNLLDNAADALENTPGAQITIRTRHQDGWVTVEIEDNGPGIPEEIQPRIFEAFFTTKPPGKGTGLGLDTSYRIVVYQHRGDIQVVSRPGSTVFRVSLPMDVQTALQSPQPASGL